MINFTKELFHLICRQPVDINPHVLTTQ